MSMNSPNQGASSQTQVIVPRRNLLIAGAGRSGTSAIAGLFHGSGYYMGDNLYAPRPANPKGFFENEEINSLNESIIEGSLVAHLGRGLADTLILRNVSRGQHWLAAPPIGIGVAVSGEQRESILKLVRNVPFCFKDPRFCFTVEAWLALAPETTILCIFRDPRKTADSIRKEMQDSSYLHDLRISVNDILRHWRRCYFRLLLLRKAGAPVLFIRYEELNSSAMLDGLEAAVGAPIRRDFYDRSLNRSDAQFALDRASQRVFELLEMVSATGPESQAAMDLGSEVGNLEGYLDDEAAELAAILAARPTGKRRAPTGDGESFGLIRDAVRDVQGLVREEIAASSEELLPDQAKLLGIAETDQALLRRLYDRGESVSGALLQLVVELRSFAGQLASKASLDREQVRAWESALRGLESRHPLGERADMAVHEDAPKAPAATEIVEALDIYLTKTRKRAEVAESRAEAAESRAEEAESRAEAAESRVEVAESRLNESKGEFARARAAGDSLRRELDQERSQVEELRKSFADALQRERTLLQSNSFRLTAPLRTVRRKLAVLEEVFRFGFRSLKSGNVGSRLDLLRLLRRKLPLPVEFKRRLADDLVLRVGWIRNGMRQAGPGTLPGRQGPEPIPKGADGAKERPGLLFVDHRIPTPDRTSASVRTMAIITLFSEAGYRCTVVSASTKEQYHWVHLDVKSLARYETALLEIGVALVYGFEDAAQHLREFGESYALALLAYPDVTHQYLPLVRTYCIHAEVLYDTVDLHHLRYQREADLKKDKGIARKADETRRIEVNNIEACDGVIAITPEEKQQILALVPTAKVEIIPNIHEPRPQVRPFELRNGLLFIGHFLHAPNVDAMLYFVREILPRIRREIPDITLDIIGSCMTETVRSLQSEHVHAVGFVEDPLQHFESARVFVAPLRFGAGMKGKIGQSMELGLPIVTTNIGAEGMALESGHHVLIADSPEDFAKEVVRLYRDPLLWLKLAQESVAHLDRNFSMRAVREQLGSRLGRGRLPTSEQPCAH
jgi:glycosyltransferase involved in cell wall biosynthesis